VERSRDIFPCHADIGRSFHAARVLSSSSVRDGFHYKFWVYILSSGSGTLYVGVTGFFERRIYQHKYDTIEGFHPEIPMPSPVYYESHQDVQVAIAP